MLIEAVLSDLGLQMGKGEGADRTLTGCQPLCQTCDLAHSWRQLLLPNPFLLGIEINKQGKFCAQQILHKPRIVMWHTEKWQMLRKWTGLPEQSKKGKK